MRDIIIWFIIQCLDKKFENYYVGLGIFRYELLFYVLLNFEVKLIYVDLDWYCMEQ